MLIAGATGTNCAEIIKLLIGELRDHGSIKTARSGVAKAMSVKKGAKSAKKLTCRFTQMRSIHQLQILDAVTSIGVD